ncbi:MAG: SO2930 family diheme c-type cytochrome [Sandaracinaceae bacterium]
MPKKRLAPRRPRGALRLTTLYGPLAAVALLGLGCGDGDGLDGPPAVDVTSPPPERLSSFRLFAWDERSGFSYNDRVVPYELNTPLFSDFALKERALYLPEGEAASFDTEQVFAFPVGTAIVKTFYYPADLREPEVDRRLLETRVLLHTPSGWEAWPYIWNEEQTDAVLSPAGRSLSVSFVGRDGEGRTASYLIPQRNQCLSCHERSPRPGTAAEMTVIGPAARHLHRTYDYGADGERNQLEYLDELGMLSGFPGAGAVEAAYDFAPIEEDGLAAVPDEDLDKAARDYMDINCAHCHSPLARQGVTSQLFLNHDNDDEFRLGVCKRPGSAGAGTGGLTYDIVPGNPDESILVFRVETTRVGAMMPLLGRSLEHDHGAELLRAWVGAMPAIDCDAQE